MTSVFLTISLLCLWIYVLIKEHQNNKRYKETLNVMKRMWDFEKELCGKIIEVSGSNRTNQTDITKLKNVIDEHINNKSIHAVHYEVKTFSMDENKIKTFSMEENKDDKNN